MLRRAGLVAGEINWLSADAQDGQAIRCSAKIRYNHEAQAATATVGGGEISVRFDEAQSAITPGQAVVLYDEDVLLGGGWIERAID